MITEKKKIYIFNSFFFFVLEQNKKYLFVNTIQAMDFKRVILLSFFYETFTHFYFFFLQINKKKLDRARKSITSDVVVFPLQDIYTVFLLLFRN